MSSVKMQELLRSLTYGIYCLANILARKPRDLFRGDILFAYQCKMDESYKDSTALFDSDELSSARWLCINL